MLVAHGVFSRSPWARDSVAPPSTPMRASASVARRRAKRVGPRFTGPVPRGFRAGRGAGRRGGKFPPEDKHAHHEASMLYRTTRASLSWKRKYGVLILPSNEP